jgi:hypothetical protein
MKMKMSTTPPIPTMNTGDTGIENLLSYSIDNATTTLLDSPRNPLCARYRIRTCDIVNVNDALYQLS